MQIDVNGPTEDKTANLLGAPMHAAPDRPQSTKPVETLAPPVAKPDGRTSPLPASRTGTNAPHAAPASAQVKHALPVRPDARAPSKPLPDVPTASGPNRPQVWQDNRDRPVAEDYGRLNRPNGMARATSSHLREQSPGRRSRPRSPEREHSTDRRGLLTDPNRGEGYQNPRPQAQDPRFAPRDEPYAQPRRNHDQPAPPLSSMEEARQRAIRSVPPRVSAAPSDRRAEPGPTSQQQHSRPAPSTSQPLQSDLPAGVNPERLALIKGTAGGPDRPPPRELPTDDRRDRGSRPQSPRRNEDRVTTPSYPPRSGYAHDDRPPHSDRSQHAPPFSAFDTRNNGLSDYAPTGPRRDPTDRSDYAAQAPSRELFESGKTSRAPLEPAAHARQSQVNGHGRQRDENYGRLNDERETPLGPRSAQPGRNLAADPARGNGRPSESFTNLVASSPASEAGPLPGVHPSRQLHLQPTPIQTNIPVPPPRAPAGPPAGTPTGPSPSNKNPPIGPASATDKSRNQNRLFSGINDALQGGNDRGASIRGRARQNSSAMPPPSGPPSHIQQAQPPQSAQPDLRDPGLSRQNNPPTRSAPHPGHRAEPSGSRPPIPPQGPPANLNVNHQRNDVRNDVRNDSRYDEDRHSDRRHSSRTTSHERSGGSGPARDDPAQSRHVSRNGADRERDRREEHYRDDHRNGNMGAGIRAGGPLPPQQPPQQQQQHQAQQQRDDYYNNNQSSSSSSRPPLPQQAMLAAQAQTQPPDMHRGPYAGHPADPYGGGNNGGGGRGWHNGGNGGPARRNDRPMMPPGQLDMRDERRGGDGGPGGGGGRGERKRRGDEGPGYAHGQGHGDAKRRRSGM